MSENQDYETSPLLHMIPPSVLRPIYAILDAGDTWESDLGNFFFSFSKIKLYFLFQKIFLIKGEINFFRQKYFFWAKIRISVPHMPDIALIDVDGCKRLEKREFPNFKEYTLKVQL